MSNASHNPQFNGLRQQAHDFVSRDLGLRVAPIDNIAIITPDQASDTRAKRENDWRGGYDPNTDTAHVVHENDRAAPRTANIRNTSLAVHEIAHSGTINKSQHTFYKEALAGIAERKWLQRLRALDEFRPAVDFTLKEAGLWLPKGFRYLDEREADGTETTRKKGTPSQALMAALGIYHTLPKSSLTSDHLLQISRPGSDAPYDAMKQSLEILKPGLSKEVEAQKQSADGIIAASKIIQDEAKKQGLF